MGREGASPRVLGIFFKAVVQVVLILRSETWGINPHMGRSLGFFQHRVSRKFTGRQTKRQMDETWDYPSLEILMEGAGFDDMGVYVLNLHNMVMQYIANRPILDLCK